ncbi:MAG: NAD-dependent epimerase/dehydratase family protein [Patescibacteria group bacterium]
MENNFKRKILITGGAGFIPSCLAERLIKDNKNFVVVVDNFLTGHKKNLPSSFYKNWKFVKCDVNKYKDISRIMLAYNFDFVFHYAAMVGVKRTLKNPLMVLDDLDGIKNILELSKDTGVQRLFFSSSSEVYGESVEFPQNEETTPLNSQLPYAIVKNVGEAFLQAFKKECNVNYTIFRFFNTYGPKQSMDFVMSKFISLALKNKNITIYGDGKQTRTFCYIDDNLDATINAFMQNKYINKIVNIGNDNEITILELAKKVIRITKSKSQIIHLPPLPKGDVTRRKPDISKMKNLLGRKLIPLEKGIKKVIESWNLYH